MNYYSLLLDYFSQKKIDKTVDIGGGYGGVCNNLVAFYIKGGVMIRIGIEINDKKYEGKNFQNIMNGNPGVGGADYMLMLLAVCLEIYLDKYEILVFHTGENSSYPHNINTIKLDDNLQVIKDNNVDIFIANASDRDDSWFDFFEKNKIKLILRAANYPNSKKLKQYKKYNYVKRVVFISYQEYDQYLDDDVMEKACIIENMHNSPEFFERKAFVNKNVTYMGAIVPQKGFMFLAERWKDILKEVPDAHLHVIGSGKLYNENNKLGDYGIASKDYEDQFIHYVIDEDGKIMDSVHFHGCLNCEETNKILRETSVGVPNPVGATETFCNCAVEMQSMGIPVVTIAGYSFFDVVDDKKSGFLYKQKHEFTKYIVELLKNTQLNCEMGENARKSADRFTIEKILPKWEHTIDEVYNDIPAKYVGFHGHLFYNKKYITLINRTFRFTFNLKKLRSRRGEK